MQIRRAALAVALVLTVAVVIHSPARAADQTVLGKSLSVKDPYPGDATKRSLVVQGKELLSDDTVFGNPINDGATVEIIANGANSSSQVFTMPAGAAVPPGPGWKALGNPVTGYSYKDSLGVNGPVKSGSVKKAKNGTFTVKVAIKGALGPGPQPHITVLPPAPGTDGGMRFTITAGDTYCVAFGGAAGGEVTNSPTHGIPNKAFKIASKDTAPTSEAGCPSAVATTTSTSTSSSTSSSSTSTSSTSTSTSSTTTSTCPPGPPASPLVLKGSLTATPGRFNYNLTLGLPGANSACSTNFAGTHACTYSELQAAAAACDLIGLQDTGANTVTSFWAIDSGQPPLQQCNDAAGSGQNWEYATAHTMSRGQKVSLNNSMGTLGALQSSVQCNFAPNNWVGCCQ